MKLRNRFRPRLEQFEDRITPAVNVVFDGANLAISGDPSALTITQAATSVTVTGTDASGAFDYGPFGVTGNISASLSNSVVARTVTLALAAATSPGNVSISTGNSTATTTVSITATTGGVAGNLSITGGNGVSSVTATAVDVGGNVSVNLKGGVDDASLFAAGSVIGGSVTVLNTNTLTIGAATSIGGNVTINNTGDLGVVNTYLIDPTAVGNSLFLYGGSVDDTITSLSGAWSGQAIISLGNGLNTITASTATFLGGVTYIGGSGVDTITSLAGSIGGNVTIILGHGATNSVNFGGVVLGRMILVQGGNGADTVSFVAAFSGIGARMSAYLGNGADTFNASGLNSATDLAALYIDYGNGVDVYTPSATAFSFKVTHRNK